MENHAKIICDENPVLMKQHLSCPVKTVFWRKNVWV